MEYLEEPTSILIEEVQELKQKVDRLELFITEKLIHLEKMLEQRMGHLEETNRTNVNVQESLHRMNRHIDFVNDTYSTLQSPLNYFKNKVECFMGYDYSVQPSLPSSPQLPSITYDDCDRNRNHDAKDTQ